jgi:DNA helicase-2/ATP-dependent DNA helicase PcrA
MKKYIIKSDARSVPEKLARYREELNEEQFRVVTSQPKAALVVAGAGTGKTRTITYRVAYLIEQGVSPARIMLATFTNRAARLMLQRVEALTGSQNVHRTWGGTFHRIANLTLRRHAVSLGYDSSYSILDSESASRKPRSTPNRNAFPNPKSCTTSSATRPTPISRSRR